MMGDSSAAGAIGQPGQPSSVTGPSAISRLAQFGEQSVHRLVESDAALIDQAQGCDRILGFGVESGLAVRGHGERCTGHRRQ